MPVELAMAWRFIRSRRKEGLISVVSGFSLAGICLGLATLIIVMSVMNGFRVDLFDKLLGVNGHVLFFPTRNIDEKAATGIVEAVENDERVEGAARVIQGNALAISNNLALGAIVRGIDKEGLLKRRLLAEGIVGVDDFDQYDRVIDNLPTAIVGYRLAKKLRIKKGGKLTMVTPAGQQTPFGVMPRFQSFRVIGTLNTGLYDADNGFVFMSLHAAAAFLDRTDGFDYVEARLLDPDDSLEVAEDFRDLENVSLIKPWQITHSGFFNALKVESNVMFIILTLIVVVAAFNIISGQIMLVRDKSNQIGLLRAIGMSRVRVWIIFLITGAFVGVVGAVAGTILGVLFTANIEAIRRTVESIIGTELFAAEIYYVTRLPAILQTEDVLTVVATALGLTFMAALYPAWRASRLNPAEILRDG